MLSKLYFNVGTLILAVIIPLAISVFLIIRSYQLERKNFDIEVNQIVSSVFFSLSADYEMLDSIIHYNFSKLDNDSLGKNMGALINHELVTVYRDYESINDKLSEQFKVKYYYTKFLYSLEIDKFELNTETRKIDIINDHNKDKNIVLFGNLTDKETAASYSFYHMGDGTFIQIRLFMDYPGKNSFIISRISLLIIGTFLSMLVLIFILVSTLRVIFWQRCESEMKTLFIDNITHEFNTPVSTLKIAAANLKNINKSIQSDKLQEIGIQVNNQAERLSGLISKIMSLSTNESEIGQSEMQLIVLNDLAKKVCENFRIINIDKIKSLKLELRAIPDKVMADHFICQLPSVIS